MATGWELEARLHLIREVFMVIGHHEPITSAAGPKEDSFYLVRAILEDEVYRCSSQQRLIATLKKSSLWDKVKQFLENINKSCARKGCNCHILRHHADGICEGSHYKRDKVTHHYKTVHCTCPKYIAKEW